MAFYVLAVAEMIVPAFAEWGGRGTAWHPEHISERYGLFTLIVLGECVAAATVAMQEATTLGLSAGQIGVATGGLLLIFSFWWWYFEHPAEEGLRMSRHLAFLWGYAHYFVFASVAALELDSKWPWRVPTMPPGSRRRRREGLSPWPFRSISW